MINEDTGELRRDLDRIKSDLRGLRAELSTLTGDTVRAAKVGAAEARERIDESFKAVAAKGKASVEAVEEQVAAHPLLSLAAAFAVGMAAGLVFSRRD